MQITVFIATVGLVVYTYAADSDGGQNSCGKKKKKVSVDRGGVSERQSPLISMRMDE